MNVTPPPDATITVANVNPDYALEAHTAFTASVPDAGTAATYAWTVTGLTINGGQNSRTINFSTTCASYALLEITVTAGNGCTSTAKQQLGAKTAFATGISPTVANSGSLITITGTTLDCLPPIQLHGYDSIAQVVYQQPVAATPINRTTAQFRMPANAVDSTRLGAVSGPSLSGTISLFIDRAAGRE